MRSAWVGMAIVAALAAGGQAAAREPQVHAGRGVHIDADCDIGSDYDFHLTERSVVFLRDDGTTPGTVLMRQGRLFVDGSWTTLSPADAARVADYEREARAAMPLAQKIGRDAVEIAFTAIGEVAAGFSRDPEKTRATLAEARTALDARMARSVTANRFSGDELGDAIGDAVAEVIPVLVGDIVGGAVRAAFGGDTARLRELEGLDQKVEALIQPRARELEKNADVLCRRMEALDQLENSFEYRLPDGRALDLLEVRGPTADAR